MSPAESDRRAQDVSLAGGRGRGSVQAPVPESRVSSRGSLLAEGYRDAEAREPMRVDRCADGCVSTCGLGKGAAVRSYLYCQTPAPLFTRRHSGRCCDN